MPSPPWARRLERSTCVNISKTADNWSAAMPMPLSRTDRIARSSSLRMRTSMRPPGLVYLAALVSRLASTCVSLTASPWTITGSGGSSMLRLMVAGIERWPARIDRGLDDQRKIERLPIDLDQAPRDA